MADQPGPAPPPDGEVPAWEQGEERFWKRQKRRHEVWKNVAWLAAGILLAVVLNQLGCSGLSFG